MSKLAVDVPIAVIFVTTYVLVQLMQQSTF